MSERESTQSPELESLVAQATEEFLECLERGERPSIDQFADRYPQAGTVLRQVLCALETLRGAPPTPDRPAAAVERDPIQPLGDFLLVAEIARGGMGVVYRAEQISLGRQVALKVLPLAAALDERQLQRFKIEAHAAATLHHEHIVPIYSVGCDRGVHYYAMQYIDGHTLAAIIRELRELRGLETIDGNPHISQVAEAIASGTFQPDRGATGPGDTVVLSVPNAETAPVRSVAGLSSERGGDRRAYFRGVAELIRQAAQALEHAHQCGVIHRDVKPGNLMVDQRGHLWVTDFGLAHLQSESDLTLTGDLVGTIRYMSPEQARGQRGVVDQRTDVYSLGVTLYELLTLQPAFPAADRRELLHQVLSVEPRAPRGLDRSIPKELEIIALKAMAKDPAERYRTARALADDLQRFHEGLPIEARPVTRVERVVRWCRRNPAVTAFIALLLVALVGLATAIAFIIRSQRERTLAQIDLLLHADPQTIPGVIEGLQPFRRTIAPRLNELANKDLPAEQRWRLALMLIAEDERELDYLRERLLIAAPDELPLITHALSDHREPLVAPLWEYLQDERNTATRRFRAACALAEWDPDARFSNAADWRVLSAFISRQAIAEIIQSPSYYSTIRAALRPIRASLLEPLQAAFSDGSLNESDRYWATNLLADYAGDSVDRLVELVQESDEQQFDVIFSALENHAELAAVALQAALSAADGEPPASVDRAYRSARRQANAAVALLRLGAFDSVWPLLAHDSEPTRRSLLLKHIGAQHVDARIVAQRLAAETEPSIRRALILSLGNYESRELPAPVRAELTSQLVAFYRDDPEPGVRGAAEWVLRTWSEFALLEEVDAALATGRIEGGRRWYLTTQGHAMAHIDDGSSLMIPQGFAPLTRLGHSFFMAVKEVTLGEYRRFSPVHLVDRKRAHDPECPVHGVQWYRAAAYCNWLSEQEGIPEDEWCFLPNGEGKYAEGMQLAADYVERGGYRLPTEQEWEYACRAGAVTEYAFGNDPELLRDYGWFSGNSRDRTWPVGSLRPNDFGIFDMHGNVWEWTANVTLNQRSAMELVVTDELGRVLRGGSFFHEAGVLAAGSRYWDQPTDRDYYAGIRLCRTDTGDRTTSRVHQSSATPRP